MAGKALFVVLPVIFFTGASFGHNNSPEPKIVTEVKIVRVPEVITHVETKTVTVTTPLPPSCWDVMTTLTEMATEDAIISKQVGITSNYMDKAGEHIAMKDIVGLNDSSQNLSDARHILNTALNAKSDLITYFQKQVKDCGGDIKP